MEQKLGGWPTSEFWVPRISILRHARHDVDGPEVCPDTRRVEIAAMLLGAGALARPRNGHGPAFVIGRMARCEPLRSDELAARRTGDLAVSFSDSRELCEPTSQKRDVGHPPPAEQKSSHRPLSSSFA